MAIDTAARRLRALDFNCPIAPGMPAPDGAIDSDDRAGLLWLYYAPVSFLAGVSRFVLRDRRFSDRILRTR